MGMYNEVYKSCPKCGSCIKIQIGQIVLGFGQFDLDSKESLAELSGDELNQLYERIKYCTFTCDKDGCGGTWSLENGNNHKEKMINKLMERRI